MGIFDIIKLLGGLAMFLYGIEIMGDGLKNSSGAALKKVLEKVTGNVLVGVLTGTLAGRLHRSGCQHRHNHHRPNHPPDGH